MSFRAAGERHPRSRSGDASPGRAPSSLLPPETAGSYDRASCDRIACDPAMGDHLRRMYDSLVSDPMPSGLVDLCDALEDAFHRGALYAQTPRKTTV